MSYGLWVGNIYQSFKSQKAHGLTTFAEASVVKKGQLNSAQGSASAKATATRGTPWVI